MRLVWSEESWEDYLYWQKQDKKMIKKINDLIKDIDRNGVLVGIGKPEALKDNLTGLYSRRIDGEHRLIYQISENGDIVIASCRGHYE